jgi:hypothetical protein
MDKWFRTSDNIEFIANTLNKKFIAPVKKNRKIALQILILVHYLLKIKIKENMLILTV